MTDRRRVVLTVGRMHDTATPYRGALEAAGLEVLVFSSADVTAHHAEVAAQRLDEVQGVVLAGGGDIDPAALGETEPWHPLVYGVDGNRDAWERAVFDEAWRRGMPVLAICRGAQVMNWALGGTLWADIDDQHEPRATPKHHRQTDYGQARGSLTHPITVSPDSLLGSVLGEERLQVNSIHHQAIRQVGAGLVVTARADDGVIEAVEDPSRPFAVGVQFHPEELWAAHPVFFRLFEAFSAAVDAFSGG